MEINIEEFRKYLKEREESNRLLADYVGELDLPTLPIRYEDLLLPKAVVLMRLLEFLSVEPNTLKEKTKKHTSDDLRKGVPNIDEIKAEYVGNPYDSMFDEILVPGERE